MPDTGDLITRPDPTSDATRQGDPLERRRHNRRSLSSVLLRRTLTITLVLGMAAAAVTMWIDLQREKDAVERLARDFMSSVTPSAGAAIYNYDDAAASQVAKGLFLGRAVTRVQILNEGDIVVDEQRQVAPTLPQFALIGPSEVVEMSTALYAPGDSDGAEPIGSLSVTLDRSLVAPEFVGRLLSFFAITTAKNMLFGLALYWLIFNMLAQRISELARVMQSWVPSDGASKVPDLPKFLRRTEVEGLGACIERLTASASRAIDSMQQSHDAVVDSNVSLSDAVLDRTQQLEKANSRLQNMADHDGLTRLKNRAYFDRFLTKTFKRSANTDGSPAIVLIDVDHFKAYNDFYGHQAGDSTLVRLAEILKKIQVQTGCLVARYGGEEFVCLLNSPNITAKALADKIHDTLEKAGIEHHHSAVARRITVSIGTASAAENGSFDTADALVSAADDALYEAKNNGRNQTVVSTPEIQARAQDQRMSLQALLSAIEKQEFEPYAQPQVDARTGALLGAEALVRWVRPDGKVIAPGEFMETAEATGLIKKIDAIMLDKIGKFLSSNPYMLPNLSFNVTGDGFQDETYVAKILELARSTPTGITVELLETAFIDQPDEHFLWQLDMLRDAGVGIEIDDFGTGRTSILGLMAINPDRLKIARELITPLGIRENQKNIVTSVVEIARSLNMNVIAEGIETQATVNMLIDIGCPIQQGYFHGKPMPLAELAGYGAQSRAS